MRGQDSKQASMFSVVSPEARVPANHPLRPMKAMTEAVLGELSPVFDGMYSRTGRPSIPPERLLKAQILIALYTVRRPGPPSPTAGDHGSARAGLMGSPTTGRVQ